MYRPYDPSKSRIKMHSSQRLRSVEVARGRAGYGFTLSGQSPCIIGSVIKDSPAEFVGLKPGDQICAVNEINVKKASHEDVVKLIGKCSGVLHMVISEGARHMDLCSSDEEIAYYEGKTCLKPRLDSKAMGINRAERVVEEMQSGGIFSMIFENPVSGGKTDNHTPKQRSRSMSASHYEMRRERSKPSMDFLSTDEISKMINSNSNVFSNGVQNLEDFELDASILNVGMIVGYLGSIELPSSSSSLEYDSLQAIRGCMRRLRAEQKIHSLVLMKIMHDNIQLCNDKVGIVAVYPADKLAFSAVCPDDKRFFGLVTMQNNDDQSLAQEEDGILRTSCHVFMVDPELFHHKIHQGIARRFAFECTPDPDTNGCLEFPPSSMPVLQFVSVLYRDMGEIIEGVRARAFLDNDADAHQNNSTSSNSDSGIGNFNQEEKTNRVLVVDLGSAPNKHIPRGLWENAGGRAQNQSVLHWNGYSNEDDGNFPSADKPQNYKKHLGPSARIEVPVIPPRGPPHPSKKAGSLDVGGQKKWLPVHVIRDWQQGNVSDQESYADSTDGWSSVNCGTLPPPMSKIPADRYRVEGNFVQPPACKDDWSKKAFDIHNIFGAIHGSKKSREDRKSSKFGHASGLAQGPQRSSGRRSHGRSKRFSITRSLDNLEAATVSDGELNSTDLKGCVSENSLSSNASLPSVQSCRKLGERRVASWAVSFERLLQDPVGVRYFTEFLKKEFSEENILFWQACEYFSRVPAHDKNELSYRAREIFNKFLSSKATTPVNIDSQAQLADDILNAPHPDMFKEQQLQIFNLMKFDSYTRFLKSHLYQECMLAEVEGRSLPDPQEIPSSPTSKHSVSSDRSNISTPKKQPSKKTKSGRSLNEESGGEDDNDKRRKGTFFSWSRSKSIGKSQKKKENGDVSNDSTFINGGPGRRRESQGSVSSSASLEMINCGSNGSALEFESSRVSSSEKSPKHCYIALPDGSSCAMVVKTGFSIKEILSGLCEKHGFNIAAVDLFLVGGNKPLVLSQDSSILESRDLRIEKRTLFRLDLVPINRSVGLKAKPTKPVTEVLRPVVAKYGLNLSELVARLSGEQEPLDLGVPISTLDGQRVVLEEKEGSRIKDKAKTPMMKSNPANSRNHTSMVEDRPLVKSSSIRLKGEFGKGARDPRLQKKDEAVLRVGRKKQHKINLDEAEAFFEMISKAQSNRAEDQRGLLRKEDLVLPDFLRLSPSSETSLSSGAGQTSRKKMEKSTSLDKGTNGASRGFLGTKQDFTQNGADRSANFSGAGIRDKAEMAPPSGRKPYAPFNPPLSPIPHVQDRHVPRRERHSKDLSAGNIQTVEDDNVGDLTLVAEGDISSPNSTLLPMPPTPPPRDVSKLSEANFSPPPPCTGSQGSSGCQRSGTRDKKKSLSRSTESFWEPSADSSKEKVANQANTSACLLPAGRVIDVDGVKPSTRRKDSRDDVGNLSFEGYISELKTCKGRMRTGVYRTSDLPAMVTAKTDRNKESDTKHKATFV